MYYSKEGKEFIHGLGLSDERATEIANAMHIAAEQIDWKQDNPEDTVLLKIAPMILTPEEGFFAGVAFTALCQVAGILD